MIAKIESKTQYGRMGVTEEIYPLTELDGDPVTCFAHSTQDALEWAQGFPLYKDAIIDDIGDGRFIVSSQWQDNDTTLFDLLYDDDNRKQAKYRREQLVIAPVNTIYENVGFFRYTEAAEK